MGPAPGAEVGLGGEVVEGVFREAEAGTATLSSSSAAAAAVVAAARVRRRSSIVSVELVPASAPGDSALRLFCYQQFRSQAYLTGVALVLSLCCLPFGLSVEPMIVALASLVTIPDASSSVPCEGLLMDNRGVAYAGGCLIGSWMASLSVSLLLTEVAPRFPCTLPHWLAGSAANSVIFYAYARSAGWVSGLTLYLTEASLFAVFMIVPGLSLVGWYVATVRSSRNIAVQLFLVCVLWGVTASASAAAIAGYVVLSNIVSGSAGLIINGTDFDRLVGSPLHTVNRLPNHCPGFLYPLVVCVCRRIILKLLLKIVRTDDASDLAGLSVMSLEIMASGPQFYVLTRWVLRVAQLSAQQNN
jgi:hypothetical protein